MKQDISTLSSSALQRRGLMYVLSSPSGAGKTTITRALLKSNSNLDVSTSITTRPCRPGEIPGRDYHFVDEPEFNAIMEKGDMLEYAKVFGHFYGTPRAPVEESLAAGRDVIFDIDWQGTQQLADISRNDLVTVFILPPSAEELERRLHDRGQDSEDVIRKRLSKAADEISHYSEYDYVLINQDIDKATEEAQTILNAERLKRRRIGGLSGFVKNLKNTL